MPSSLTWVDQDAAARERSLRILALFQEKESRDELGLGGIRDSFSDRLFPGTSTIQTRLRYMLFVPWVYQRLERERVPAYNFAARARRMELELMQPLLTSDDRAGVFGIVAGKELKRLPSSVYWAGLGAWGIRRFGGSQEQYHRSVDALYQRRVLRTSPDEGEAEDDPATITWNPRLPPEPPDFPRNLTLALTSEEAAFLQDRIVTTQPESLLAHLVLHCAPAEVDFPWEQPDRAGFRPEHNELLEHARRFSEVMYGAAILYNLALAELDKRAELTGELKVGLAEWAASVNVAVVRQWSLPRLWDLTLKVGHTITPATRRFVESWVGLVRNGPAYLADDPVARDLIRYREMRLKGPRSRFTNTRAREQWGGYAGLGWMSYRWPTVRTFLHDLHAGCGG